VGYTAAGRSSFLRRRYALHPADEMFLASHLWKTTKADIGEDKKR
jgi:hypothetical protein